MSAQELVSCPFCGSSSVALHPNDLAQDGGAMGLPGLGGFYAHCNGCGAEGPQCDDEAESIRAWNRRAPLLAARGEDIEETDKLPGAMRLAVAVRDGTWPHSTDAQVWAQKWLETLGKNPAIATDEGTMIGWFANAIMAGYDTATMRAHRKSAQGEDGKLLYDIYHCAFHLLDDAGEGPEPDHFEVNAQRMRDLSAAIEAFEEKHPHPRDWMHCSPEQFAAQPVAQTGVPEGRPAGFVKPDNDRQVFFYEQDFYVLSNFSAFNVKINDQTFETSEAAYHWFKFPDAPEVQLAILHARSAHEAFKIAEGNKHLRRPDWDAVKADYMLEILREKVEQHEYVRRKLLATCDRELIEDSWRDDYWGWGPNRDGQNVLGKLWMRVRAELLAAAPTPSKEA